MKNPGLSAFSVEAPVKDRPSWYDDDDIDEFDDETADPVYKVPPWFSEKAKNPGHAIHTLVGQPFKPGEEPEDVIHGEVISPAEQDAADGILNGEHKSGEPSSNPLVEGARQHLQTPGSDVAVGTLADALRGRPPSDDGLSGARNYLVHQFSDVEANPEHGVVKARSAAGSQVARFQPDGSTELTNKHGTFRYKRPEDAIEDMIAFQYVTNAAAAYSSQQQKKRDDDDDDDDNDQNNQPGLRSTSGWRDLTRAIVDAYRSRKPQAPFIPPEAVPDLGGHVVHKRFAPPGWHHDPNSVLAVSPDHPLAKVFDQAQAGVIRPDPNYQNHTYTFAPDKKSGHTEPRQFSVSEGLFAKKPLHYYVKPGVHPSTWGEGFDVPDPAHLPQPAAAPVPRPAITPSSAPAPANAGEFAMRARKGSVMSNDLCPVCVASYLVPFDGKRLECLNCGSLVDEKHVGYEAAARPDPKRRGLGRGLGDIPDPGAATSVLGLEPGGRSVKPVDVVDQPDEARQSQDTRGGNPNEVDENTPSSYHPHGEAEDQSEVFQITPGLRERGRVRRTESRLHRSAGEPVDLDKHLEELDWHRISEDGRPRAYLKPIDKDPGKYFRLTEIDRGDGSPVKWRVTHDLAELRKRTPEGWPQPAVEIPKSDGEHDHLPLPESRDRRRPTTMKVYDGGHPLEDPVMGEVLQNPHRFLAQSLGQPYEPALQPAPPTPGSEYNPAEQERLRGLSSVSNPGLSRFVS